MTNLKAFKNFINDSSNKEPKNKLNSVVKKYLFLYITNALDLEKTINQNLTNSSVIMINHYRYRSTENDELHFIIVFRKTVLFIKRSVTSKPSTVF